MTAARAGKGHDLKKGGSGRLLHPEPLPGGGQDEEVAIAATQAADIRETRPKELPQMIDVARVGTFIHSVSIQMCFARATAVSPIRSEKPHSLSYQESTRTKVPSITLVWSIWNTDERLSWLKSLETLGLSV